MIADIFYKLDNPAWYALEETHRDFAVGRPGIKCYKKNIVSFLAFDHEQENALDPINDLTAPGESFFIIGHLPPLPANYSIETSLPCAQMVCRELKNEPASSNSIEKLGETDEAEMLELINRVQPGYFLPGTRLMGDYYGIRVNTRLVAITGERMRPQGLTEVSAVVTHPEFTGRQFAQQLVAHIIRKNLDAGIIPFLHVAATNERAISIYKKLGFVERRMIVFWKIKRDILSQVRD